MLGNIFMIGFVFGVINYGSLFIVLGGIGIFIGELFN